MSATLAMLASHTSAGPWSLEPRIGASAEYDSNPGLSPIDAVAEDHIAGLFYLPLRYDADNFSYSLVPQARLSNTRGYSSLASNYVHIDSTAQLTTDRSSYALLGNLARDSSFYHAGEAVNGVGVRRDTASLAADSSYSFTARSQLQMDASWSTVHYDQTQNVTSLVDYRYLTAGPTVAYLVSERDTIKISGTVGSYQSLNAITSSKSQNLQLQYSRQLSEAWTASGSAGYTRSTDTEKVFFGSLYLETFSTSQNGVVYAANLSRQGERFVVTANVSRALQPTGLAYLARQDSVSLLTTFKQSDRWDYQIAAGWQKQEIPEFRSTVVNVKYLNVQLTANWHWTDQWIVSLHALRIADQFGASIVSAASNGVSIDVTRQFLRTDL